LQCVAVCCSVLQCVAVCCSVLQFVAVCCSVLQCHLNGYHTPTSKSAKMVRALVWIWYVLQCVATCCSVLQRVAVCWRLPFSDEQVGKDGVYLDLDLSCAAVCCCVWKYVAEFCRVLQIVAV